MKEIVKQETLEQIRKIDSAIKNSSSKGDVNSSRKTLLASSKKLFLIFKSWFRCPSRLFLLVLLVLCNSKSHEATIQNSEPQPDRMHALWVASALSSSRRLGRIPRRYRSGIRVPTPFPDAYGIAFRPLPRGEK